MHVFLRHGSQGWKTDNGEPLLHSLPSHRPYEKESAHLPTNVSLADFPMKMVTLTEDIAKQGVKRWRVSLKTEIRNLHSQSVTRRGEWHRLLEDFDKQQLSSCVCIIYCAVHIVRDSVSLLELARFSQHMTEGGNSNEAIVPIEAAETTSAWPGKPGALDDLLARYDVEVKLPARQAGAMLYITKATDRHGERTNVIETQAYKLFLVPRPEFLMLSLRAGWQ